VSPARYLGGFDSSRVLEVDARTSPSGAVGPDLKTYPLARSIGSITIDSDGANFRIGVGRTSGFFPNFSYSVELHYIHASNEKALIESTVITPPSREGQLPRVWSKYSSTTNSRRFGAAFERFDGAREDMWNATYDMPADDGPITSLCDGTISLCPCGNGGAPGTAAQSVRRAARVVRYRRTRLGQP